MEKITTALPEVWLLQPRVFDDNRGYFMETYSERVFESLGITDRFIQDNHSYTAQKGTLRGLHFQNAPYAQSKIVRVVRGAVMDVAVDIRKGSPNYLKWTAAELSAENKLMMYIPRGFAHGFVTLTDDVEMCYKVDQFYCKEADRSIRYDDPSIGVIWGSVRYDLLSAKDAAAPLLADSDCNFVYTDL